MHQLLKLLARLLGYGAATRRAKLSATAWRVTAIDRDARTGGAK